MLKLAQLVAVAVCVIQFSYPGGQQSVLGRIEFRVSSISRTSSLLSVAATAEICAALGGLGLLETLLADTGGFMGSAVEVETDSEKVSDSPSDIDPPEI